MHLQHRQRVSQRVSQRALGQTVRQQASVQQSQMQQRQEWERQQGRPQGRLVRLRPWPAELQPWGRQRQDAQRCLWVQPWGRPRCSPCCEHLRQLLMQQGWGCVQPRSQAWTPGRGYLRPWAAGASQTRLPQLLTTMQGR